MSKTKVGASIVAASLFSGAGVATCATAMGDNLERYTYAIDQAQHLADERTTCRIATTEVVTAHGRNALRVTVDVQPGILPQTENESFDGLGSDVTLKDQGGNLINGALATQVQGPFIGANLLDGNEGNGPSDPVNRIDIPLDPQSPTTWTIERLNAVQVTVHGLLVREAGTIVVGQELCGSVEVPQGPNPLTPAA